MLFFFQLRNIVQFIKEDVEKTVFLGVEVVVLGEILGWTTISILTLPEASYAPKDQASKEEDW